MYVCKKLKFLLGLEILFLGSQGVSLIRSVLYGTIVGRWPNHWSLRPNLYFDPRSSPFTAKGWKPLIWHTVLVNTLRTWPGCSGHTRSFCTWHHSWLSCARDPSSDSVERTRSSASSRTSRPGSGRCGEGGPSSREGRLHWTRRLPITPTRVRGVWGRVKARVRPTTCRSSSPWRRRPPWRWCNCRGLCCATPRPAGRPSGRSARSCRSWRSGRLGILKWRTRHNHESFDQKAQSDDCEKSQIGSAWDQIGSFSDKKKKKRAIKMR